MIFISAQPATQYYVWQLKVQLQNFKQVGINHYVILLGTNGNENQYVKDFISSVPNVFAIPDRRNNIEKSYPSSIRPYLLRQFFGSKSCDFLKGYNLFYLDCDVLMTCSFKWDSIVMDKSMVYCSDTITYIGANYILSKSEELLDRMCEIVDIDSNEVISNEKVSGGAQYIFGSEFSQTYWFWDKVLRDSISLYELMNKTSWLYSPSHPIQAFCADMWSLLWNIWKSGNGTSVIKEMDFCWPTQHIENWNKLKIMHNAGVQTGSKGLFCKSEYINTIPNKLNLEDYNPLACSLKYVEAINKTTLY